MKGKLAGLYADVEYAGNRLNDTRKLGDHAQRALKEAKRLFDKTVLRDDQKTWFHFAHQLQAKENEDDYLEWFTVLFSEISEALDWQETAQRNVSLSSARTGLFPPRNDEVRRATSAQVRIKKEELRFKEKQELGIKKSPTEAELMVIGW
jgi:hypothetical protein